MDKVKVYIAGPISNEEKYEENFKKAEKYLLKKGFVVLNPVKNIGFEYNDYIDMGLIELSKCDAIYMLKNSLQSPGARLELTYAHTTRKTIIFEDENEANYFNSYLRLQKVENKIHMPATDFINCVVNLEMERDMWLIVKNKLIKVYRYSYDCIFDSEYTLENTVIKDAHYYILVTDKSGDNEHKVYFEDYGKTLFFDKREGENALIEMMDY